MDSFKGSEKCDLTCFEKYHILYIVVSQIKKVCPKS